MPAPAPPPPRQTTRSLPGGGVDNDGPVVGAAPPRARATRYDAATRAVEAAKPAKDYLPFIDVAIDESAVQAEYGAMLQDRYTRIQIVTLKPDAYDIDAVSAGRKKKDTDTRNYKEESRNWLSRMMNSRAEKRPEGSVRFST